MKIYYVAKRLQRETDVLSCLLRHGFTRAKAAEWIISSKILHSSSVIAYVDEGRAVLIIAPHDGQLWSFFPVHFDQYRFDNEADACKLAEALIEEYPLETFAVFSSTVPPTLQGLPQ